MSQIFFNHFKIQKSFLTPKPDKTSSDQFGSYTILLLTPPLWYIIVMASESISLLLDANTESSLVTPCITHTV